VIARFANTSRLGSFGELAEFDLLRTRHAFPPPSGRNRSRNWHRRNRPEN
jgi:hypothetical protein